MTRVTHIAGVALRPNNDRDRWLSSADTAAEFTRETIARAMTGHASLQELLDVVQLAFDAGRTLERKTTARRLHAATVLPLGREPLSIHQHVGTTLPVLSRKLSQRIMVGPVESPTEVIEVLDISRDEVGLSIGDNTYVLGMCETVHHSADLSVTLIEIKGRCVRLGIHAPREVPIHREEIQLRVLAEQSAAARGVQL